MSLIKRQVADVAALAREVAALADGIVGEIDNGESWDHSAGKYVRHHEGAAPGNATHSMMGSASSATLRRRSMDLTRALATMRKGDLR